MDYKDLGYSSSLVKQTATNAQPSDGYMYAADSPLMIGGLGASQISEGSLQQDITLESGRILITDPSTGTVITIGNLE